jgi:YggT family protein
VRAVQKVCYQLTEPLLAPIRNRLPPFGGLDLSPVVLLLGLQFLATMLIKVLSGTLLG